MSARGDIIDNIKTELEKITTGNGYNQTVALVESDKLKAPEELTPEEFPALFIIDSGEIKAAGDIDSVECHLEIIISGYIRREWDTDDLQDLRRKLQNDVEKCLMVDETRNHKAIKTQCTKIVTDNMTTEPYTIFDIYFDVQYFHDRNNPSSQANSPVG
jgi:hypothetical protein